MKKRYLIRVYSFFALVSMILVNCAPKDAHELINAESIEIVMSEDAEQETSMDCKVNSHQVYVQKRVLSNGLTVLVRPVNFLPKVTMQLWYHVGSKDEKTGEKGFAHLNEHMVFKGTIKDGKKVLSESDINVITHMLSGSTNAFTSWDYTGYLFNLPVQNWKQALPIFADCMQNVGFAEDHLNSEMKAVISELKMYRDNYVRVLFSELMASIFSDHPYHYPVIGFKHDLFNVHADALRDFYKKHYWPNNAVLVIVGDVDPEDAFKEAEHYFSKIPANPEYKKETFYYTPDLASHSVTLYRDIKQPQAMLAYVIPGAESKKEHLVEVIKLIIAEGKGSRLYRKLVDELQLVSSLGGQQLMLFEHGILLIFFEPKKIEDLSRIQSIIQEELDSIAKNGILDIDYTRALKQARMDYYGLLESIEAQAREIGKAYLATGDENYAFHFLDKPKKEVENEIQSFIGTYLKKSLMHTGLILPLSQEDKKEWQKMQKKSDISDQKFLESRVRTTPIEPPLYAKKVKVNPATEFDFPKYKKVVLKNGITLLYYDNNNTPKMSLVVDFKARPYYDSQKLPGIYNFIAALLTEGTQKYTANELADELESRGIGISIQPGTISMNFLSTDLPKALELLEEIIFHPRFDENEIEKVRAQLLTRIKAFWDEPQQFSRQLIMEEIYAGHPYSKNIWGTEESIQKISRQDLIAYHKKFFSPHQARVALVGDLSSCDLKTTVEPVLTRWKGIPLETVTFPALSSIKPQEKVHQINRDQAILAFAGLSVDRLSPDYDKLLLFDQIFSGGALGSLHSKLYQLREQSGLFYNISGSLISGSSEQPGMVLIKTLVSLDRLQEAQKAIAEVIEQAVEQITPEELAEARSAVVNSIVNNFATNGSMAQLFIAFDRYGFPADYYDKRADALAKITLAQVKEAVKKVLKNDSLYILKVGRIETKEVQ